MIAAKCKACPYYEICRGCCQRSREYLPEEDAYISHFCAGYQYFFEHCLNRMQEIAKRLRR